MPKEKHQQPLVSIDVVPIAFIDGKIKVALAPRRFEPFIGELALPGVLLAHNETINEAVYRALESKAGIDSTGVRKLIQVGAFDNPDRDPRGPTISIALVAIIEPGAATSAIWSTADTRLATLPFDHANIISDGIAELGFHLWRNIGITKAIIGDEFSTSGAITVTEQLTLESVDRSNFTRMLKTYSVIEQTGTVSNGKGRPSASWRFKGI